MTKKNKDPAMGVLGYERNEADFYPTPEWCTKALLSVYDFKGGFYEPCCGDGAISKVLSNHGKTVSYDLHDRGYGVHGVDFLEQTSLLPADAINIVTNPPYTLAEEFIRHSLKLTQVHQSAVAMLLRNEYDCASSRTKLFDHVAFSCKVVLTRRPRWIVGTTGSPRHNYSWYVWDWSTRNKQNKLIWTQ